jgi:signal peptidase
MKLKHRYRRIIVDISTVLICILSIAGFYLGLRIALRTTTPWIAVASGSMSPALNVGDLVIIQGVPPNQIKVGDIIVFDSPPSPYPTIHRVIRVQNQSQNKTSFVTKGDVNVDEDAPVAEDLVHGRVIYRIPILGYLALDPSISIILILVIVVVILIWPEKGKSRMHLRKRKKRREPMLMVRYHFLLTLKRLNRIMSVATLSVNPNIKVENSDAT